MEEIKENKKEDNDINKETIKNNKDIDIKKETINNIKTNDIEKENQIKNEKGNDENDKKSKEESKKPESEFSSLEDVLTEKEKANSLLKAKKYSQAEKSYKKILENIDILLQNENIEKKNEIIEQKKFIMSNLAFSLTKQYKISEGMKYDRIIIKKLDKTFAKSYARLIDGYIDHDKLSMARYHYDLMKSNVDEETINKCSEVINKLKSKLKTKDQEVDGLLMLKNLFSK